MPRSSLSWLIGLAAGLLAGCNLITGADGLRVGDGDEDEDGSGGSGQGSGLAGSGAGAGQGGGAGGAAGSELDDDLSVDGITVDSIVLYQGVERPLMEGGAAASTSVPVVAGRDALVRVFYRVTGPYNGQPVAARLLIDGADPIVVQATPSGTSNAGALSSTINFQVPAAAITAGSGYRVDLLQPPEMASGNNAAARYPSALDARDPLHAEQVGVLTVTLVPVAYNGDGSGRLPDTSGAQLDRYADLFYAMYPVAEVKIQVRSQPMSWGSQVAANGNGWDDLLNAVADLRNGDNAAFDNYYYGIFSPTSSFNSYCGGGCVLGLGFVGGPSDDWSHSAIGVGFGGDTASQTAVHEIGHNHGREHAPCGGASGPDPNYPYAGASIGSWGYDLLSGQLYDPNEYTDLMGYCSPAWISDYNYARIFERVQFVTGAASIYVPAELQNLSYRRAKVSADHTLSWLEPIVLLRPPLGELTTVTVDTVGGPEQAAGSFVRYDHLDGGVLFIAPTAHELVSGGALSTLIDGVSLQASIP